MLTVLCYFALCYGLLWSGMKKIILNTLKCCVLMNHYQILYQNSVNDTVLLRYCLSKRVLRWQPIPLAAVWVCGHMLAGIAGSNPTGAWISVFCECCVLSGRGLCFGLTTRPEESYRVWCVQLNAILKPR